MLNIGVFFSRLSTLCNLVEVCLAFLQDQKFDAIIEKLIQMIQIIDED